jgi:hypothetical protein
VAATLPLAGSRTKTMIAIAVSARPAGRGPHRDKVGLIAGRTSDRKIGERKLRILVAQLAFQGGSSRQRSAGVIIISDDVRIRPPGRVVHRSKTSGRQTRIGASARVLDPFVQIRLFGKLKLVTCAWPGL